MRYECNSFDVLLKILPTAELNIVFKKNAKKIVYFSVLLTASQHIDIVKTSF